MHEFQAVQAQRSPKSPGAFQAFRAWKEPERSPKARPKTRTKFWKARKLEKPENARPEKTLFVPHLAICTPLGYSYTTWPFVHHLAIYTYCTNILGTLSYQELERVQTFRVWCSKCISVDCSMGATNGLPSSSYISRVASYLFLGGNQTTDRPTIQPTDRRHYALSRSISRYRDLQRGPQ